MARRTAAERLAAFAHGLRLEDVPPAIVEKAKLHILDTLGCAIAGADTAFARASLAALRRFSDGRGSVAIGQRAKPGLRDAIMFNAGIGHMLDFDDTHTPTLNHVSVVATPLVLALGAHLGRSGRDMLTAYLVAAETGCRVGLAAGDGAFLHRGVHPTGAPNAFGAALAAGRLMGLDEGQMVHAQGIALGFAAGSMEWQRDGAEAKRLHPGIAAVGGLSAASYAAAGITGPRLPYEGDAGLYRIFLGERAAMDRTALTAGLGRRWAFRDVSIKAFPLVHHLHGVIECALRLVEEEGVRPDAVERVTALIAQPQIAILCEPERIKRSPTNAYQGIFSLYHTVALALARRRVTLEETGAGLLDDPEIAGLRRRIDYAIDPDSRYPRSYSGGVLARMKDGRELVRHVAYHPGAREAPLPPERIVAKFRDNAGRLYLEARIATLVDTVMALDRSATPADLAGRLGASGG